MKGLQAKSKSPVKLKIADSQHHPHKKVKVVCNRAHSCSDVKSKLASPIIAYRSTILFIQEDEVEQTSICGEPHRKMIRPVEMQTQSFLL